ncbi:putative transport protein [Vibrio maritimus]|uniref:Putative transport protein n=1 Tax=Vibrio maritimus TaxID=990268 RepID=A0A090RMV0_9VIBR|nr:putative transport protein [Vibrio maritimus]
MFKYLICSFALVLLYPTAIDLYLVGLPQIAADLSAMESQLHIAFSIYLAGMATTMLLAGKLSDSLGRKPMAIAGAAIFVGASLMGGAAEQVSTFLAARFAQGIGAGSCYVVAFAILRDTLDDKRRAKVLSMINGITCIVPVIAPVVGHLIMLKFPWQGLFTTMAGMGVLVCLLSLLLLKETKPTGEISKSISGSSFNLTMNAF